MFFSFVDITSSSISSSSNIFSLQQNSHVIYFDLKPKLNALKLKSANVANSSSLWENPENPHSLENSTKNK